MKTNEEIDRKELQKKESAWTLSKVTLARQHSLRASEVPVIQKSYVKRYGIVEDQN